MLAISVALALLLGASIWYIHRLGAGDWRVGRLRMIRRIRATRRRRIARLGRWLRRSMTEAWTRPARSSVAAELRRVADRVERVGRSTADFIRVTNRLDAIAAQLEDAGDRQGMAGEEPRARRPRQGAANRGWLVATALGLAGCALAAANGWLLHEYVIPGLGDQPLFAAAASSGWLAPAAFALLSFLLGLAYFTLTAAGRKLGLRIAGALAVAAVTAQAVLEGAAVVSFLHASGLAQPDWWGGVAVAVLLGGAAALVPPAVAALAHAAVEQLDRWIAAGQDRAAARGLVEQDRTARRIQDTLHDLSASTGSLRSEVVGLGYEQGGRILFEPAKSGSVDRGMLVLRRIAAAIEEDREARLLDRPTPAAAAFRLVVDSALLLGWIAAAAAAVELATQGLLAAASTGSSVLLTGGAFAALITLSLSGTLIRMAGARSARPLDGLARASLVLVVLGGSVSLALALGPFAARAGVLDGQPLTVAGWLNVLVLAAAAASARLPEGVSAAGSLVTLLLAGAAVPLVWLVDRALSLFDRILVGFGRQASFTRRAIRGSAAAPGTTLLGADERTH